MLKIGSAPRPPLRRALAGGPARHPWVFAWSQNRHMITGWYGFGRACAPSGRCADPRRRASGRHVRAPSPVPPDGGRGREIADADRQWTSPPPMPAWSRTPATRGESVAHPATNMPTRCPPWRGLTAPPSPARAFTVMQARVQALRPQLDRINLLQVSLLRAAVTIGGRHARAPDAIDELHCRRPWLDRLNERTPAMNPRTATPAFSARPCPPRPRALRGDPAGAGPPAHEIELIASETSSRRR